MEHLALEIFDLTGTGSKYAVLPEDTAITITDTSEIFASGDVWSHSFTLNVEANIHIFGSAGEMHGARLHEQVNKRRARLWVEGLPLYLGYLKLDDETEVDGDGNVDVAFESGQKTFDEMIEGAKANQVPMMGDVRFGVALWRKRWVRHFVKLTAHAVFKDNTTSDEFDVTQASSSQSGNTVSDSISGASEHGHDKNVITFTGDGENEGEAVQEYPSMVFPEGDFVNIATGDIEPVDCINTDYPYDDEHPYCNVALCYQKQGYEKKNEDGTVYNDYSAEPEPMRGYESMPASRINSAPNFFVIYWIRALMHHLGINIEENQMMDVEDLRRLFFVNTRCAYREPKVIRDGTNADAGFGRYTFREYSPLGFMSLVPEQFAPKDDTWNCGPSELVKKERSSFVSTSYSGDPQYNPNSFTPDMVPEINYLVASIKAVDGWTDTERNEYKRQNGYLHDAFATSECFPEADISEVIKAIESGFGVRFLFSDNYQRVRIVLLRNIFRSEETQAVECEVIQDTKTENAIRGFRMTYGDNKDNTEFFYKGFDDKLPHKKPYFTDDSDKHDYSQWNLNADYGKIMQKTSAFDKTCYVTPETGDAYIIKIDKDAKRYEELHPSLFESAAYMDAEDGDCTGEENTIETVNVGFVPAIMNDLNVEQERKDKLQVQRFALFLDETMRPRRKNLEDLPSEDQPGVKSYDDPRAFYDVDGKLYAKENKKYINSAIMSGGAVKPGEFAITSDMFAAKAGLKVKITEWRRSLQLVKAPIIWDLDFAIDGHINEGYRLYLQDNFEPNDEGRCPVENHDWGLTLGIMRGSGSDAYVDYKGDPDDGEGNDTWDLVSGSSATVHPDTCDNYGKEWDYNGSYKVTSDGALEMLAEQFPNHEAPFYNSSLGYITETLCITCRDDNGIPEAANVLVATAYSNAGTILYWQTMRNWMNLSVSQIRQKTQSGIHVFIEANSSQERGDTLVQLCKLAYNADSHTDTMIIDDGVGSRYGRFSLKLRAEKPNPYFDPKQEEGPGNRRYLQIENKNLQGRGLCDQFYKEYSYWVRNARIANRTVHMELAQYLAIDKTKKVKVGDITGFIRKRQCTVSKSTGLGDVKMEILYI